MIGILFLIVLYFLPSIFSGNNRKASNIIILNFALGWTLIGWVIALIWAFDKDNLINK